MAMQLIFGIRPKGGRAVNGANISSDGTGPAIGVET